MYRKKRKKSACHTNVVVAFLFCLAVDVIIDEYVKKEKLSNICT
jgi:hypothetical protein